MWDTSVTQPRAHQQVAAVGRGKGAGPARLLSAQGAGHGPTFSKTKARPTQALAPGCLPVAGAQRPPWVSPSSCPHRAQAPAPWSSQPKPAPSGQSPGLRVSVHRAREGDELRGQGTPGTFPSGVRPLTASLLGQTITSRVSGEASDQILGFQMRGNPSSL